jgi:galactose mutarotase-like enzyme
MEARRSARRTELPLPIIERREPLLGRHDITSAISLGAARIAFVGKVIGIARKSIDGMDVGLHFLRNEASHGKIFVMGTRQRRASLVGSSDVFGGRSAFGLVHDDFDRHTSFNMKSPLLFQNQPAYQIADGENKVLVSPDHGARILRWERNGQEIITWPDDADWSKILKVRGGNPVLFPFIARHFVDGKNELWRDASGTVRPMPQHGFSRDAKFSVVEGGPENELRMRLIESDETRVFYPFAFQFDVVVGLLPASRLEVRFETTNTGNQPLPYYAGHHFYFALPHAERGDWTLHLPCAAWGRQSPDGAIVREEAKQSDLRIDDATIIDRFQIEPKEPKITLLNRVTGKRLVFELDHPNTVPWYAVTTWTQAADSDFYCIEPWLGLPNAIHHGEGLHWLAPGAKEVATLVLDGSGW